MNCGAGACCHTDWRLPNVNELESLVNAEQANSADWLNGQGFANVQANWYWSSSTSANGSDGAWFVSMWDGLVGNINKSYNYYVWPVRAGQSGSLGNLIIHYSGTGTGRVSGNGIRNGNPVSFSNYVETEQFDIGTTVNLHGEPSEYSYFTGWPACGFTMTAIVDVTANFDFYTAHKTRIGDTSSYRSTLQEAYDDSPNPGTVKAWATDFSEELTCGKTKDVTLKGGYNGGYTSNTGYSTLQGKITVQSGSLTVENLLI